MLKIEKSKTAKLLALSFMLNITVVQPVCSTITYAATRDSDYHTIENSTSKKIQSSREYLYTPYKSNAERQAEAEAIRQQQAEAEAQRKAAQEAHQQSGPSSSSPSGSTYNSDGTVKELGDEDSNVQQARERLQQMMQNNPRKRNNFNNPEEKKSDSLSSRISNQLSEKDKEVLLNTYNSVDEADEKYRMMAIDVCNAAGLSNEQCRNNDQLNDIQNCLWGELSHIEASGAEYEKAQETAMQTCVYVLQSGEKEVEQQGVLAGLKNLYNNWDKKYKENMPEALKFVLGDSLAEVGVTAGLTLLSFASFGISAGALASLRAAKAGTKLASKADKMAGLIGKSPNLSEKFASTLSKETQEALKLADSEIYKNAPKEVLEAAQKLKINGYGSEKANAVKEMAEEAFGKNSEAAKLYVKATENAVKTENKVYFNVLERTSSNYAKVIGADLAAGKVVNAAGAGDALESRLQNSEYDVQEVRNALQDKEFAELLESKRSNAEVTRIAKSVSASNEIASTSEQISGQVERNLSGIDVDVTNADANQAQRIMDKSIQTRTNNDAVKQYILNHPKKISDGLKDLGVTPEEIKKYQK